MVDQTATSEKKNVLNIVETPKELEEDLNVKDNHVFETSELDEPVGGFLVSERKQIHHLCDSDFSNSDAGNLVFTSPPSEKGVSIKVYEQCIRGTCVCKHKIGNDFCQFKPCRFAALLYGSERVPSDDEKVMFKGIVDGFNIISTDVDGYDNHNYLSILSDVSKPKMDKIVKGEIKNGILVVDSKPKCIHSLGAVGKPDGGIRPLTDCSLPIGKCINDSSVDDVIKVMNQGDYITVVDIKMLIEPCQ